MQFISTRALAAFLLVSVAVLCDPRTASADPAIITGATPDSFTPFALGGSGGGAEAVDPNAIYSDVTTTALQFLPNGGASGSPTIFTDMILDDLTVTQPRTVTRFVFSVVNGNGTTQSVQPSVRFYTDNVNTPGTLVGGVDFSAFNVGANVGGLVGFNLPAVNQFPSGSKLWAGVFFRGTNATTLNNLGQFLFNPPDVGTSANLDFDAFSAGAPFTTNNPVGIPETTAGTPVLNYGWEIVPEPGSATLLLAAVLGGASVRRRRIT